MNMKSITLISLSIAMLLPSFSWANAPYGTEINPLQAIVNAASPGQVLTIPEGTYNGTLVINKSLTLIGLDRDRVILQGTSDWDQIVINASNIRIADITVSNYWHAIMTVEWTPWPVDNVVIDSCNFINDVGAVGFYNVTNFQFSNNNIEVITRPMSRVSFSRCDNLTIQNNNFTDTDVYLSQYNSHALISGNNFKNQRTTNPWGLIIQDSWNNTITRNTFIGKPLAVFDSYNTVSLPNIPRASNNLFYLNNFIGNAVNVQLGYTTDIGQVAIPSDFWDNSTHGNFWSDYTGIDLDGNGIGDTPYIINLNNTDRFPLMTDPLPEQPPHEENKWISTCWEKISHEPKIQWLGAIYFP